MESPLFGGEHGQISNIYLALPGKLPPVLLTALAYTGMMGRVRSMTNLVADEVTAVLQEATTLYSDTIRSHVDTTFRRATGYDYDPRLVLPSPEYLKRCEDAEPGSALRIMDEWSAEQDKRRQQELAALKRYGRRSWFKLGAVFVTVMVMLMVPIWLIEVGYPAVGTVLLLVSAVSLSACFAGWARRSTSQTPEGI